MFVPGAHARVHIAGIGGRRKKKPKQVRRKMEMREMMRMPCLLPTVLVVVTGLLVLAGGAGMCVLGYVPDSVTRLSDDTNTTTVVMVTKDSRYYATKSLSYAGPVLMGCGFFAIIVSCVLYCEIVDRYAVLMPNKPETRLKRKALLDMILTEFKKSYFRGIEVPLRKVSQPAGPKGRERSLETFIKAVSMSTPVLLMSPDLTPSWRLAHTPYCCRIQSRHVALKPRHPKLKQLSGSGGGAGVADCGTVGEGSGSEHEAWLKTSSLPNICHPELRGHTTSDHLPQSSVSEQLQESGPMGRMRRFGRPSRGMDGRISCSLPQTLYQSSLGVDKSAYLHDQERRRSLSMCVHGSCCRRLPARYLKTAHLQPRLRLQQLQLQQLQKQQQQLLQQQQPAQQKRAVRRQKKSDSEVSSASRRCGSDEVRPARYLPRLSHTRGAHMTFDCTAEPPASSQHADPPPFPLPAHFMQAKKAPPPVSARTTKLLKAKCQSLDIRDKSKPDVILLKDLFKTQDCPAPRSPLCTQMSTSSLPCTASRQSVGGQQSEKVTVTVHTQDKASSTKPQLGTKDSAFVRVIPSKPTPRTKDIVSVDLSRERSRVRAHVGDTNHQRYQLPLLSGASGTSRQWEVERRRTLTSDCRQEDTASGGEQKTVKPSPSSETVTVDLSLSHSGMERGEAATTIGTEGVKVREEGRCLVSGTAKTHGHTAGPGPYTGSQRHSQRSSYTSYPPDTAGLTSAVWRSDGTSHPTSRDVRLMEQMTSRKSAFINWCSVVFDTNTVSGTETGTAKTPSQQATQPSDQSASLEISSHSVLHHGQTLQDGINASLPGHRHATHHPRQCPQPSLTTLIEGQVYADDSSREADWPADGGHEGSSQQTGGDVCQQSPRDGSSTAGQSWHQSQLTPSGSDMGSNNGAQSQHAHDVHGRYHPELTQIDPHQRKDNEQELNDQQGNRQQQEPQQTEEGEMDRRRPTIALLPSVPLLRDCVADTSMSTICEGMNTSSRQQPLPPSPVISTTSVNTCSQPLLPPPQVIRSQSSDGGGGGGGLPRERERHSARRQRFRQSRSLAVDEVTADEEGMEHKPLTSQTTPPAGPRL